MNLNDDCQVTVIIPAYNEAGYIATAIKTLVEYLNGHYSTYEIIVVDDGSRDATFTEAGSIQLALGVGRQVKVMRNEVNSGKGFSIQKGALASEGKVILFMDADLSYALEAVESITRAIAEGADLAIGSRLVKGAEIHSNVPMARSFTGRAFNMLVQLFLFRGIPDTQCGIKGFSRQAAMDIFKLQTVRTFGFDVELLYIARLLGYRIDQIPVNLINYRTDSRVQVWRDSWRMFRDVMKIRWQGMRGIYRRG